MRHSILSACTFVAGLSVFAVLPAQARVTLDLDYTYDANEFFSTSTANGVAARAAMSAAADYYSDRFLDTLSAIVPSGQNTWTPQVSDPSTGLSSSITLNTNPTIAQNVIKVYVGGYALPSGQLGFGGPNAAGASGTTQAWFDTVFGRGQTPANASAPTDYGPWGGSISFSNTANWNFSVISAPTSGSQSDFLSTALHELGHVMGVGTAGSFTTLSSGLTFTGPKATAAYGGTVPLANSSHLGAINSTVTGADVQQVEMSPSLLQGTRKYLTALDWAALDDLGWDLAKPGDANASGTVDFDDLLALAKNYGSSTAVTWSEGDFNYDRQVNFNDLLLLAKNYGSSGPLGASAEAQLGSAVLADFTLARSLVPEPTSLAALVGLAGAALVRRRAAR